MVTYTTNKNLALPAVAGDSGVWGGELNNGTTTPIDLMLGGANPITLSATNYTLSGTDVQYLTQKLSGTLLASVTVYSSCSGFYFVENNTSGSFTVTWQANFGGGNVGTGWVIPQGTRMLFISDATAGARPAPVQPAFTYTDIQQISTPATPAAGFMRFYAKTSNTMAAQTPGGTEFIIGKLPTLQSFTSIGSGTYTPTAGTIRIRVRMVGGGGGGGGYIGAGGQNGGTTTFGTWSAIGGNGGYPSSGNTSVAGGAGGTDGTGTKICRMAGSYGGGAAGMSGVGGNSVFGGAGGVVGATAGANAAANSGSGGGGGQTGTSCGGGGSPGEYVEFWMTASQIGASLSIWVGAGGAGGTGTYNGGAGGAGLILVEEYFN